MAAHSIYHVCLANKGMQHTTSNLQQGYTEDTSHSCSVPGNAGESKTRVSAPLANFLSLAVGDQEFLQHKTENH